MGEAEAAKRFPAPKLPGEMLEAKRHLPPVETGALGKEIRSRLEGFPGPLLRQSLSEMAIGYPCCRSSGKYARFGQGEGR